MNVVAQAVAQHDDEGTPSFRERVRTALLVPARLFGALFLPDRTMPLVVREQRTAAAFVACTFAALVSAAAIGARYDGSAAVLAKNAGAPPSAVPSGTASAANASTAEAPKSDREIADEIAKDRAVTRVKLGLGAGAGTPFTIVMLGLGLFVIGRYVGGKATMQRTFSAAAYASLPGAVRSCVAAAVAWRMPVVRPDQMGGLVPKLDPANPVLARLFGGVDLFTLWTVVLCGFGLAAAGSMSKKRAFVTVVISFALWLAVTRLVMGGPPPGPHPQPGAMHS